MTRDTWTLTPQEYLRFLEIQTQATHRIDPNVRFKVTWAADNSGFTVAPFDLNSPQ